jgi:hypothetical protein
VPAVEARFILSSLVQVRARYRLSRERPASRSTPCFPVVRDRSARAAAISQETTERTAIKPLRQEDAKERNQLKFASSRPRVKGSLGSLRSLL